MTERVRAILISPSGELLTIRRDRPGMPLYWVLPGGHVEPTDSDREAALCREVREELGGLPQILGLVAILDAGVDPEYVYLARIDSWCEADRNGPEFDDPSRGSYVIDVVPLTIDSIERINLKPAVIAMLLIANLTHVSDLLTMPSQRMCVRSRRNFSTQRPSRALTARSLRNSACPVRHWTSGCEKRRPRR